MVRKTSLGEGNMITKLARPKVTTNTIWVFGLSLLMVGYYLKWVEGYDHSPYLLMAIGCVLNLTWIIWREMGLLWVFGWIITTLWITSFIALVIFSAGVGWGLFLVGVALYLAVRLGLGTT